VDEGVDVEMRELDLDAVDWASLRHSGGSAIDVPVLLQDIVTGDDPEEAVYRLSERICAQGVAVVAATSYLVPILIKIAQFDGLYARRDVLRLVRKISDASHAWRSAANNALPEHRGNYAEKIAWEEAVDNSFAESLPGLMKLSEDKNGEIAGLAQSLVSVHGAARN
jgi:hypothetical protein